MKTVKIAVIGGDRRMFACAESLYGKKLETALYGFDKISDRASSVRCKSLSDCLINASAVILPLPLSKNGETVNSKGSDIIKLREVFEKTDKETPIFAGYVSEGVRDMAKQYGHELYDYYENETLLTGNAVATAEGGIFLAMQNSDIVLRGSKCLVTGYGRIGQYTAKLLKSFGADVTVCARSEKARMSAVLDGCSAISVGELSAYVHSYDFIFNTVPAVIFDEKVLSEMLSTQIYIELASAPFGADKNIASRYNIEIVDGSSLPSRYSPKSAGEYIADVVREQLERLGII